MDIEFLLLAGAAEVVANKLYAIGAGWNEFRSLQFPTPLAFYVAFSLIAHPDEAEQEQPATLSILGPHGPLIPDIHGKLRIPHLQNARQPQRALIATSLNVTLPGAGLYTVKLRLGASEKEVMFEAVLTNPGT